MQQTQIRDTAHYDIVVDRMLLLEELSTETENEEELNMLAAAVKAYDDEHTSEPPLPKTLRGLLEVEMSKRNMKQRALATLLEVPETRISEMLKGKRAINFEFACKLHTRLHVSAEAILTLQG